MLTAGLLELGRESNVETLHREHEHLREPPSEGIFVHGLSLHGCVWDNPPGEARDYPVHIMSPLPVVHIHMSSPKQLVGD